MFDKDGDGVITKDELRDGMHKLGIEITEAEAEAKLKEADQNDDGHVRYLQSLNDDFPNITINT